MIGFRAIELRVRRLERKLPPKQTPEEQAEERFYNRLRRSRSPDALRITQAVYRVLAETGLTVEGLLNSDRGIAALEQTERESGEAGRLTGADLEQFARLWRGESALIGAAVPFA